MSVVMTKGPIKAVLFDLDGVLVDAREWHYDALNRSLALFGCNISRFDHLTTFDGLPTRTKLERLNITEGLPLRLQPIINSLKQSYTREIIATKCYPVFHIEYALARLKRDGYQLAVCTNSIRDTLNLMLTRSGIFDYFDVRLSSEDVEHPKPHPEIYQSAIARLGRSSPECIAIEDNPHGFDAVNNAGAHLLRVTDPKEVTYDNILNAIAALEGSGK
jgi:HAD superfamily hydrolase (TIGR01509 family)